jgi:(E)-4-hydroxy-3-methylbut-2-enyl-diphosphate synthase
MAGKPDHKMDNGAMVEHIVGLVEARAKEIQAQIDAEKAATLQAAE